MKPRQVKAKVQYDNKDISEDLAFYLLGLEYTDVMSGEADDLQIKLENKDELWTSDWFPEKGATLTANIATSWQGDLDCGIFEIDEISGQTYPNQITLKAVSVPNNNLLRGTSGNRSWEKTKLSVVAGDIATKAEMELVYQAPEDPELERVEKTESSDLDFLLKLCKDNGLSLKIFKQQIIILDEAKYEEEEAKITIASPKTLVTEQEDMLVIKDILSCSFKSKTRDVYTACKVTCQQSQKKAKIEGEFKLETDKPGKTLIVNEQVKSIAEAEKLAKKRLREKNKDEVTMSFRVVGDINLVASATVNVQGYGKFDGKYIITRAQHSMGSGYTTNLELRKCLDGY